MLVSKCTVFVFFIFAFCTIKPNLQNLFNDMELLSICVRRRRTLPNAVEIDILGIFEGYSSLQIWPPQKIFQGRNYSGRMT